MRKEKLMIELNKKLKKLDMPYFRASQIEFKECVSDWEYLTLNFTVPYHSLKNLIIFCTNNNFSMAYDNNSNELEICLGKISKIRKLKGVNKNELL